MQRGWRNFGGVLREISVRTTDPCHIRHVVCVATPGDGQGYLTIEATARNARPVALAIDLRAEVLDRERRVLATLSCASRHLAPGTDALLRAEGDVPGVRPWSPDSPSCYTVRLSLLVADVPVATQALTTGFRTIEVRGGELWLNGAPVFLTGFNRHEDSPDRNMRPDLALARRDFEAMKDAGANFVRLCHYPHDPAELDLCDELGLLVMEEIPLYWWNGLEEGEAACAAKLAAAKRQLERLIRRDVNHPSVVFWSVSNETQEDRPEVATGNAELVRLAKSLDATRLAVHVSDHWQGELDAGASGRDRGYFTDDDVICVNAYPSAAALTCAGAGKVPEAYDLGAATAFWREGLAALHKRYPHKPILVSEFGSVSLYGVVDGPFGGDLHAEILEAEFAGMDAPYVCGATVWCWADHAWPPATFGFGNFLATSPYGVLTRDRRRKAAFWTAHRLFRARQGLGEVEWPRGGVGPAGREIYMVRPNLENIPQVDVPDGYRIRTLRPDEGGLWTDIWREADPWTQLGPGMFAHQFGDDLPALQWRSFIVENEQGVAVATTTAWYNRSYKGDDYGQIHWVATRQSHWRRGIGKAMLSYALQQMARWHDKAFLGTQTQRVPAIKLYLDFGFVPDLDHPGAREAWREVKAALHHPVLEALEL